MNARKKIWWPPWAYETRPWAALILGSLLALASLVFSIAVGSWSLKATGLFGVGCVLSIYAAIVLQLRREYRETSKWTRTHPPQDGPRQQ